MSVTAILDRGSSRLLSWMGSRPRRVAYLVGGENSNKAVLAVWKPVLRTEGTSEPLVYEHKRKVDRLKASAVATRPPPSACPQLNTSPHHTGEQCVPVRRIFFYLILFYLSHLS